MTAPSPPTRVLEARLADALARIEALERGRSTQLGNASLDGTVLRVVGPDGTTLQTWGTQPDGNAGTANFNPNPPPKPNTPIVTSVLAGLSVEWNGELQQARPSDFSHVAVHVSPVEGFIPSESNHVGVLYEAGSIAVAPLDYITHYVKLVAVNTSKKRSDPSFEQHGSPGKVVADEVLDGIVGDLALAEEAVSEAKLAAGAVTSTKIDDNAVTTPKLVAGAVQADKIAARAISGEHVVSDAITTEHIKALSITAEEMGINSVTAGKIKAGSVDATKLAAEIVLGSRLIAGDPNGPRVEMSASGLLVIRDDGDTTFQVDSSTGDVTSMGEYYTSRFGERLAMNSGGLQSPTIRAYPARGSRYADLRSYTRTIWGGSYYTDIANWEFRVPLAPGSTPYEAGLVDFCVYNADFNPIGSSRLRYRPFDNGSGNVHPGWAADGQNCAIVFWENAVWITNSANTGRQPLIARGLWSQADVISEGNAYRGPANRDGAISWDTAGALVVSTRNGAAGRGVWATNFAQWGSSWRGLKTDHTPITDYLGHSALDEVMALDIQAWRYRPTLDQEQAEPEMGTVGDSDGDNRMRIGLHLDELHPKLRLGGEREDGADASSWDVIEMLNVALAAVQEQQHEIEALRTRIEELETPSRGRAKGSS